MKLFLFLILSLIITSKPVLSNENNSLHMHQLNSREIKGLKIANSTLINLNNQEVDNIWYKINATTILEFDDSNLKKGYFQILFDDFYIYFHMKFSNKADWLAVEFNAEPGDFSSMKNNHDGFLFKQNESKYDISFLGLGIIPQYDSRDDYTVKYIHQDDYVDLIVKRPFITQDTTGNDFNFSESKAIPIKIASNIKPEYHNQGTRELYIINLDPKIIQNSEKTQYNYVQKIDLDIFVLNGTLSIFLFSYYIIIKKK